MCGIAGIVGPGRDKSAILRAMVARIAHRGPDGEGFFEDESASLGHRRLAVIDLSASADQPMSNEDGSVQLVYNGEVYNFEELRADLLRKGHTFRSRTCSRRNSRKVCCLWVSCLRLMALAAKGIEMCVVGVAGR